MPYNYHKIMLLNIVRKYSTNFATDFGIQFVN